MWYGLVDPTTGDLVSIGTEAMFQGGVRPEGNSYANLDIVDFGATAPNGALKVWDRIQRQWIDRPIPARFSRLDDFQQALLNDPDFSAVWGALNTTRRTQLRDGMRRVLAQMLGGQQWRDESETVEI